MDKATENLLPPMMCVTQPWASCAVVGTLDYLNIRRSTAHRGPVVIVAGGIDPRLKHLNREVYARVFGKHNPYLDHTNMAIGLVAIEKCGHKEGSDLTMPIGPWVATVRHGIVLDPPIDVEPFVGFRRELPRRVMVAIGESSLTILEWNKKREFEHHDKVLTEATKTWENRNRPTQDGDYVECARP